MVNIVFIVNFFIFGYEKIVFIIIVFLSNILKDNFNWVIIGIKVFFRICFNNIVLYLIFLVFVLII